MLGKDGNGNKTWPPILVGVRLIISLSELQSFCSAHGNLLNLLNFLSHNQINLAPCLLISENVTAVKKLKYGKINRKVFHFRPNLSEEMINALVYSLLFKFVSARGFWK